MRTLRGGRHERVLSLCGVDHEIIGRALLRAGLFQEPVLFEYWADAVVALVPVGGPGEAERVGI